MNIKPAGFSDSESDSDFDFYDNPPPRRSFYKPKVDHPKRKTENLLQDAIINGNIGEIEKIINIDLNGDINFRLDNGWTPLLHACFHAQEKVVEYLLNNNADPNLHSDSLSPIMAVCSNSSANNDSIHSIVNMLISKDCLINIGDKYGQTPLMRAIASGRVAVVQALLDKKVNIEMRDQQGWTAVFWAVHNNRPEILEMLIECDVRLAEVDRSNRTPMDIAELHEYREIVDILTRHLNIESNEDEGTAVADTQIASWDSFYPGLKKGQKPTYASEIPHLLYGMHLERLEGLIINSGIDLRTFLLLEEEDMIKLGIELPYERQRLKQGLLDFHKHGWKVSAVAGLYAGKAQSYGVADCLLSLGSHLSQIYIMEATLQYTLRQYDTLQPKLKFEPPNSPNLISLKTEVNQIKTNVKSIRKEMKRIKGVLAKISRANPRPADIIKETSIQEKALDAATKVAIAFTIGLVVYNSRNIVSRMLSK